MVMLFRLLLPLLLLSPTLAGAAAVVDYKTEVVSSGLEHPWSLEFFPTGEILVTERPGRLRIVYADGRLSAPITNVPAVQTGGQDGLLDVLIDPDWDTNQTIFFTYAEPQGDKATLAVARARLIDGSLRDVQVIFRQQPVVAGHNHFGSRLAMGKDGWLYLGTGDRWDYKELAPVSTSTMGKIVRIKPDGSAQEIYSSGHRNIQGMTFAPDGTLYASEHGARGGDELNRIVQGKNYGWPDITYSRDYITRLPIGDATARADVPEPLRQWTPSVAPSGLEVYTGSLFSQWQGNVLMGTLRYNALKRLVLVDGVVTAEYDLLQELRQRIRDVKQGPDGAVYVVTDQENGQILRLVPARH
jgi:glucose/arabinose dehydrogenase